MPTKTLTRKEREKLSFNQRIELAGIEIIRMENGGVWLWYDGKCIARPEVNRIEEKCKEHFNLDI